MRVRGYMSPIRSGTTKCQGADTVLKTKLFGLKVRHFKTVSVPVALLLREYYKTWWFSIIGGSSLWVPLKIHLPKLPL